MWHPLAVLGFVGVAVAGSMTIHVLVTATAALVVEWYRRRPGPEERMGLPMSEGDLRRILRAASLPTDTDRDDLVRLAIRRRRRRRAHNASWGVWSCRAMAVVAVVVAVATTQPGQLVVAAGWLLLGRGFRWVDADELERLDLLDAELDRRHPSGFAHG